MLLITQAIRRFVHLHSPAQLHSAVHGSSALTHLHRPAQPLSLLQPQLCDAWGIVIHKGAHISLTTFTQPHSLGHRNGGDGTK